ncbi:MAG: choice-of-anchor D domain-containing protein [Dehalococcoidia bacterium]|nr:choice-of-anchor D domain-containing protein [Dehalococcoidia bacterium]
MDAFVTKFNAAGNTLAYSTYLGGSGGNDWGWGIAVDASGCAYVAGETSSVDFPMQNPYQGTYSGNVDAFVTKLGDPDITVTPTSLDFGSVAVGSSRPAQTVTVRNHGCSSLTIGTITLGGTNAGEYATQNDNCSGQSLAPGASATLQVVFNPTSASAKTATMAIPSDDRDEATVNVALSGTGTPAAPAPAPGPRASPTMHTPAPLPADIALQYLAVNPQQTYAGQPVTITTNVSNTGGSTGQYTVTLIINGQVEETRLVSVGAQSALPVKFTVTRDVPGTYTVTIGSQQASFVILGSGGGSAGLPASGGLVAILIMGVLVLITAVGLMLVLRRRAW